jgi:tetratricopeptide (TPR) repeat protein
MSPEQAGGEVEGLGPATDVYSLGATLYALLTNRPPLRGAVPEVLRRTREGSWEPPRQVKAGVPAALDAVCRKAMALRPEERYASALELAADLEHWLGDEPVSAYREPAGARLRRWARKHPRKVTAAAVLLVTAVVGLTVGTVLLERSKREAQANFEIATGAIEKSLIMVNEEFWLDEPVMQGMRLKLLTQADVYYQDLLRKYPRDRRVRQQYAGVMRLLAECDLRAHREVQGLGMAERAVRLYEELLRQAPSDRELRFGLAHAHHTLAELQLQKGALEGGEKEVNRAVDLLERLTAEESGNERFLSQLAWSHDLRATANWSRGDLESGLADNGQALEIVERSLSAPKLGLPTMRNIGGIQFARLYEETGRFQYIKASLVLLPRAYTHRGMMLNSAGRNAEAARALQEAIGFDRRLVEQDPRPGRFRHSLAQALLHTGHIEVELGRPRRAEPALREAREQMRRLCQDDPTVPEYAVTRLLAAGYLGEALFRSGRTAAAEGLLREAREQGGGVLGGPGKGRVLRAQHARLLHVLGRLGRESGDIARGLEISREAREKLERALQEAPGDPSLRGAWLGSGEELALCRFLRGDINRDACIAEQRSVLQARKKLAGPRPKRAPRLQSELAGSAALVAGLLLEGGRPAEALACVDEVLPDHERFVREEKERAKGRAAADAPPTQLAPGRPEVVWPVYVPRGPSEVAWPVYLAGRPLEPEDLELRRKWAVLLAHRSTTLARLGRDSEAAEAVRQAVALTQGLLRGGDELRCPPASPLSVWSFLAGELCRQEPCYLYDLACQLALASTLPRNAGLDDPAGRAVQALRDHVAHGFDNVYKVRTDPALAPLRRRPDFQELVRDLEARVRAKGPA